MLKEKKVEDARTLRRVCLALGLEYDTKHKYITKGEVNSPQEVYGGLYRTKYNDGCFYPFLVEVHSGTDKD